jgi:hypothetical protein
VIALAEEPTRAPHLSLVAVPTRPDLVIRRDDLTVTARDLAAILAQSGRIFHRGTPAKVVMQPEGVPHAIALIPAAVVVEAHALARPVARKDGGLVGATLPERVAQLYLALGDWNLPPLRGITTAPLLSATGVAKVAEGYDARSGMWCANVPEVKLTAAPTRDDALAALGRIREAFRTFPFADAPIVGGTVPTIDLSRPPAYDESAFLAGLLTAVCRPSLELAPGIMIFAPAISGAGTGKGLLVRAISMIAFGAAPHAFTAGGKVDELEKRIGAALMNATPVLFIDNLNNTSLRSELLASVLTEPWVDVRLLGVSRMFSLNTAAFVAVTGNGLRLSEDQARRFIACQLDARMEDPERRPFLTGFLEGIKARRGQLLADGLTIWRWGRINERDLAPGRPLGSYEIWCQWVRDPLLALGCADPVERAVALGAALNDANVAVVLKLQDTKNPIDNKITTRDVGGPVVRLLLVAKFICGHRVIAAAG